MQLLLSSDDHKWFPNIKKKTRFMKRQSNSNHIIHRKIYEHTFRMSHVLNNTVLQFTSTLDTKITQKKEKPPVQKLTFTNPVTQAPMLSSSAINTFLYKIIISFKRTFVIGDLRERSLFYLWH